MSEPPSYDKSAYGQGFTAPGQGFAAPGQGFAAPGQGFAAPGQGFASSGQGYTAPGENRVMYVAAPSFGEQAVSTVCRNCQANVSFS